LAAPKTNARNNPRATARNVISGGSEAFFLPVINRDGITGTTPEQRVAALV
jgi:hypothetical protein